MQRWSKNDTSIVQTGFVEVYHKPWLCGEVAFLEALSQNKSLNVSTIKPQRKVSHINV